LRWYDSKTVYLGYYGTIPTTIGLLTELQELYAPATHGVETNHPWVSFRLTMRRGGARDAAIFVATHSTARCPRSLACLITYATCMHPLTPRYPPRPSAHIIALLTFVHNVPSCLESKKSLE
jgi:hypothetical protein